MAFKVMISGHETLRRLRTAVPAAIYTQLEPVLRASAAAIAADARQFAPRGPTGLLKRGITSRPGSRLTYVVGVEGPARVYAHFIEYGTSQQAARPFMRPAWRREADRLPGRIRALAAALPREVAR